MPKLKLTYFDFHGGRAEPARLALAIGGVPFEDDRVPPKDWPVRKPLTPFGSIPVLEVDGKVITQCNTINRYVGKLAGLYPEDPWQAARVDEVMDAVEDISSRVGATLFMPDDQKKAAREALASGPIPVFLERLATMLQERGGEYFADGRLTVADLKVFGWIRHLRSGMLDHIPSDLPERLAPLLVAHCERIQNDERVRAYYARFGK